MDGGSRRFSAAWVAALVSLLLVVGAAPARAAFPGPSARGHACKPPARATVLASNREAVVYFDRYGERVFGCLKALGVTRLLLDMLTQSAGGGTLTAVRLAGRFAALQPKYSNQYANWKDETLYDLTSGKATDLAHVVWDCTLGCPPSNNIDGLDSVALDSSGFVAWRETTRPVRQPIAAISCPSASLCVASDQTGILTSTNPTGGASAWNSAAVASISDVSCPSISLCVAVDGNDVLTSTDPTGGASAWTKTTIEKGGFGLDAVSCASVSLCVAVDLAGNALTSTDPTGGASAWTKSNIDPVNFHTVNALEAVSCPSDSLCVAVDDKGNIVTSTDPTAGASAWTRTLGDGGHYLTAVSCASVSLCVAGDQNGNILTSTDPTGAANTWKRAAVYPPGCTPQSTPCISEQLYAHDHQGTQVIDTAPPGHGNSIGNIAFDSHVLRWTHDGAQRQLRLR